VLSAQADPGASDYWSTMLVAQTVAKGPQGVDREASAAVGAWVQGHADLATEQTECAGAQFSSAVQEFGCGGIKYGGEIGVFSDRDGEKAGEPPQDALLEFADPWELTPEDLPQGWLGAFDHAFGPHTTAWDAVYYYKGRGGEWPMPTLPLESWIVDGGGGKACCPLGIDINVAQYDKKTLQKEGICAARWSVVVHARWKDGGTNEEGYECDCNCCEVKQFVSFRFHNTSEVRPTFGSSITPLTLIGGEAGRFRDTKTPYRRHKYKGTLDEAFARVTDPWAVIQHDLGGKLSPIAWIEDHMFINAPGPFGPTGEDFQPAELPNSFMEEAATDSAYRAQLLASRITVRDLAKAPSDEFPPKSGECEMRYVDHVSSEHCTFPGDVAWAHVAIAVVIRPVGDECHGKLRSESTHVAGGCEKTEDNVCKLTGGPPM
jgi:hypothetical protein